MGRHSFTIDIAAPQEKVFDLWTNLDRMGEWIVGVKKITDVSGLPDQVGSSYVVWFGRSGSLATVLDAERPSRYRTRFGNWMLRGENNASFEQIGDKTRVRQEFRTEGFVPAIFGRLFATGSYKGSFRGELEAFKRIAEREAHGEGLTTHS